jgi:DNA-binding transcriptional MerR regulator
VAEYRIEEMANVTSTTVRTLQSYRNRGLLPPPRREGRHAYYSDDHVERVELIADLINRGYSLNAISELLDGLTRGGRIQDLLGLRDTIVPAEPADGSSTVIDHATLLALLHGDERAIDDVVRLGVVTDVGTDDPPHYRVELPAMLEAGSALLEAGVPIEAILAEGTEVEQDADRIARRFVRLVVNHLIEAGAVRSPAQASTVTELVNDLLPHASRVIGEYVQVAMRDQIRQEIETGLGRLLQAEADGGN